MFSPIYTAILRFVTGLENGFRHERGRREGFGMKAKINDEMIATMCELKGEGLSNKDICRAVGIHEATLYRWLNKPSRKLHRVLGEEFKKAEVTYKGVLLETIRDAALSKQQYWTAAAWLLERKYPEEYGRPETRTEKVAEEAPRIVLGVEVKAASGDGVALAAGAAGALGAGCGEAAGDAGCGAGGDD